MDLRLPPKPSRESLVARCLHKVPETVPGTFNRGLRLGIDSVEQMFRRMCFNIAARNQDDHVKNIAFLMDRAGRWSLAPAFDVVYAYNPDGDWTSQHQMSLNGKRDGFVLDDFKACAKIASMKRGRAQTILAEVIATVARWHDFADEAAVPAGQRDPIQRTLRKRSINIC